MKKKIPMRNKIKKVKNSIVRVNIPNEKSGTGFIVSKEGHIFSCHHIIYDEIKETYYKNIEIIFNDGTKKGARIISPSDSMGNSRNMNYDYSILKIDGNNFKPLILGSYNSAFEGDDIYFCGYPMGTQFHTTHLGIISSKSRIVLKKDSNAVNAFQISGSINKGNSGGPLFFKETDEVIGVISNREGGLSEKLVTIRNDFKELQSLSGNSQISFFNYMKIDENGENKRVSLPITAIGDLIETLDQYISIGIGYAISIEYAKKAFKKLYHEKVDI